MGEDLEPVVEPAGGLGLFERVDEIGERSVVDPCARSRPRRWPD